jgi:hypothetical protein
VIATRSLLPEIALFSLLTLEIMRPNHGVYKTSQSCRRNIAPLPPKPAEAHRALAAEKSKAD